MALARPRRTLAVTALLTDEELARFLGPPPHLEEPRTTGKGGTPIPVPTSCMFAAPDDARPSPGIIAEVFPPDVHVRGALLDTQPPEDGSPGGSRTLPGLGDVAYVYVQGVDAVVEVLRRQTLLTVRFSTTTDYEAVPPEDADTAVEIARLVVAAAGRTTTG